MPWIRRKLRDSLVYVRITEAGGLALGRDGRVDVRYKADASAKLYRAAPHNLRRTGDVEDERPVELPEGQVAEEPVAGRGSRAGAGASRGASATVEARDKDAIIIYTDGACTGNPGPAGIGVVIVDGDTRRELSEYLGQGTNNIAELTAIERALEEVEAACARQVIVHSDSSYAIGLLSKGWKAKANAELVGRLRDLAARFPRLRFVKVKGHAGVPENERCDELARQAIEDSPRRW